MTKFQGTPAIENHRMENLLESTQDVYFIFRYMPLLYNTHAFYVQNIFQALPKVEEVLSGYVQIQV